MTAACAAFALAACGDSGEEIELSDAPTSGAGEQAAAPSEASGSTAAGTGGARQGIRIVGSSTVFPFTTAVAESFGAKTDFPTPVVESTGTGGGMALFCSGVGLEYPDLTGASRPMKASEYALCQENGVTAITEIMIGFDGIVIGNSVEAPAMDIDKAELWLALAAQVPTPVDADGQPLFDAEGAPVDGASFADVAGYSCETFIDNPHQRWSDVDPDLSNARIEVFGPPPTSGTRDAFVELAMEQGAEDIQCIAALADSDPDMFDRVAARLREDGAWVDSGENDNAIVQTLANTPSSFGVFGYSFLEQNGDRIHASTINGVEPTYDNIAEGVYPVSRSLFVYVKNQHVGVAPGIEAFIAELTSDEAWGPFGYLAERGLIALPEARRAEVREAARSLEAMDGVSEE
ncbi:phosphate ABC transporter substrate-binding protein [Marinicauda salina]|uniref:Phosphate ABC transporter substrate-binding protein n=2 Tax=Marinicauda salina TaxID=2135793 RepID=A0A2U2BR30_9PROT|nr:phosphate ABC transporter substrate-binding protein [Marinicauda salina]